MTAEPRGPSSDERAFKANRHRPAIVAGDGYYAAIEFGDSVRALVPTAYGNATQPGSPHPGDQLELFARD